MSEFSAPSDDELRALAKKIKGAANRQEGQNETVNIPREFRDGSLDVIDNSKNSKKYDWVIELYEGFLKPSPWDFNDKLAAIKSMAGSLDTSINGESTSGTVWTTMTEANSTLTNNWQGELSDSLSKMYLRPLASHIPKNQGRCLLVLHDGLQGMRDIYAETRRNLKTLGDQCVVALDNANGHPVNNVQTMLTLLNNVLTIGLAALAAVNPAAGGAAGITSAVVAGGLAAADKKLEEGKEEIPLASMHPEDVMDNLKNAVEKIREELTTKEDELIKCLNQGAMETLNIATNSQYMINALIDIDLPLMYMPQGSILTPQIPDLALAAIGDPGSVKDGLFQTDSK